MVSSTQKTMESMEPIEGPTATAQEHDGGERLYSLAYQEAMAMAKYALSNGEVVDPMTIEKLHEFRLGPNNQKSRSSINQLVRIHQDLSRIVHPATPRTILMLDRERQNKTTFYFLGPVPLIRQLSGVAILFLLCLLGVSLSHEVNVENIQKGLLNSDENVLFLNQFFILFCAGLGASFAALFQANRFIANATYDPRFDSSYWSRIILGLIAGMILVELLPSSLFEDGNMRSFGKPTLAMFGGFSANVVHRIIERLVESIETLVKGNSRIAKIDQQNLVKAQISDARSQAHSDLAVKLVSLKDVISNSDKSQSMEQVNDIIDDLLAKK